MKFRRALFLIFSLALLSSCGQEPAKELPSPFDNQPDPTAKHKGPKAVFIGDSITWQWGLVTRTLKSTQKVVIPTDPMPSWMSISGENVTITWHSAFFTSNDYVDKGVSGERTDEMLARYQKDVLDQDPWCVVIMGGTNDLAQGIGKTRILENLSSMAEQAAAKDMKVILCSVTPCNATYSRLDNPKTKGAHIITLNGMIKDYAAGKGFTWCDYWTSLVDTDGLSMKEAYWLYDDLHPNPDGYTVMEGIIKPIIDKALE